MRATRGTLTQGGKASPYRDRTVEENLALLREMRAGKHPDGAHVLRAKIDMATRPTSTCATRRCTASATRTHHRTGDKWCIYPTYDWAHGVSDALENITHSICTLEFEDHRPLYDWFNERLAEGGQLERPLPQQIEFARLNLTYVVLSKRKLIQLVEEKHVDGWDDPRMPTLVGARRRGYTPEGFRLFAERIGVSKADSWIDYSILEDCMREHLNEVAPRRIAVLDPLKLVIENYPGGPGGRVRGAQPSAEARLGQRAPCPSRASCGSSATISWKSPSKGYFRLFPGNKVRLRYGFVVECIGYDKRGERYRALHVFRGFKSGTPGADTYKVKGNIHWLSAGTPIAAEVRLYDRLFKAPHPGAGDTDFLKDINPDSKKVVTAQLEPALGEAQAEERFQFERHGYFVADRIDSKPGAPVFNRAVTYGRRHGVRVVHANELDINTAQTPGMNRAAAITHARAGAEKLWAGTVVIHPKAKTGAHHHGPVESVIYVVSGKARMRWGEQLEFVAEAGPGDFIYVPPYVPHQEINASDDEPLSCVLVRSGQESPWSSISTSPWWRSRKKCIGWTISTPPRRAEFAYSLKPMARMIAPHLACSCARKAEYSSGVEGAAVPLTFANCSTTAGDCSAAIAAAWMRLRISGGVAAGATRPYQLSEFTFG